MDKSLLIVGIIAIAFFAVLFGLTGLRLIIGISLLFFLPFYLILNKFDLKTEEKVIFSIFIGFGLFSAFVYLSALLIGSIRMAMIVVFIILAAGILYKPR